MPTLNQLLLNGDTAPITKAMSISDVCEVLGQCEGFYDYGDTRTEKRGKFQFVFQDERLLRVDWVLVDNGTTTFEIKENCLDTTTTVIEFLKYCNENEIPWRIEQELSFDRQLAIRTCSSVVVIFDLDQRELQRISVNLR